jgi:methionyl-tRNA formyltransferase
MWCDVAHNVQAVSVIELSAGKFDHGRILNQIPVAIDPEEGYTTLAAKLARIGAKAVVQTLADIDGCRAKAVDQVETGQQPSLASKLEKTLADVDFGTSTRAAVYRLSRAIGHKYPLRVAWNGTTPLLLVTFAPESELVPTLKVDGEPAPGTVVYVRTSAHSTIGHILLPFNSVFFKM